MNASDYSKKETEKEGGILRERQERESFGDISHSRPKVISVFFVKVCIFYNKKNARLLNSQMHVYLIGVTVTGKFDKL